MTTVVDTNALVNALIGLIDSRIVAHNNALSASQGISSPAVAAPVAAPVAADPFGGLSSTGMTAGTAAPAIEVTPKMVTELIMPLLANADAKARLSAAMQGMGITELPAARPDQLPALYAAFKAISDEFSGAAAPAASTGGITII